MGESIDASTVTITASVASMGSRVTHIPPSLIPRLSRTLSETQCRLMVSGKYLLPGALIGVAGLLVGVYIDDQRANRPVPIGSNPGWYIALLGLAIVALSVYVSRRVLRRWSIDPVWSIDIARQTLTFGTSRIDPESVGEVVILLYSEKRRMPTENGLAMMWIERGEVLCRGQRGELLHRHAFHGRASAIREIGRLLATALGESVVLNTHDRRRTSHRLRLGGYALAACSGCGYSMSGLEQGAKCPECGKDSSVPSGASASPGRSSAQRTDHAKP